MNSPWGIEGEGGMSNPSEVGDPKWHGLLMQDLQQHGNVM